MAVFLKVTKQNVFLALHTPASLGISYEKEDLKIPKPYFS